MIICNRSELAPSYPSTSRWLPYCCRESRFRHVLHHMFLLRFIMIFYNILVIRPTSLSLYKQSRYCYKLWWFWGSPRQLPSVWSLTPFCNSPKLGQLCLSPSQYSRGWYRFDWFPKNALVGFRWRSSLPFYSWFMLWYIISSESSHYRSQNR